VRLDGDEVQLTGEPLLLNPGSHRVVATAPEVEAIERDVELAEGDDETLTLRFEPIAPPPVPPPPPAPVPVAPREPDPGSLLPALIAGGVGVAGFAVGGITGGLVLSKVSSIKEDCDGNTCPLPLKAEAEDAQTLATISNVGLIVGGVGAALAVTFVFWRPWGGGDDAPASDEGTRQEGPTVEAAFGTEGLLFRGTF
jgi:hypothetical protein